jgi:thermostable 8-oxoguanine DNA glycosylase
VWIIENQNSGFKIAPSYLERSGISSKNTYLKYEQAFRAIPRPEDISDIDFRLLIWYIKSHKIQNNSY